MDKSPLAVRGAAIGFDRQFQSANARAAFMPMKGNDRLAMATTIPQ
jgi:hypothetical protein